MSPDEMRIAVAEACGWEFRPSIKRPEQMLCKSPNSEGDYWWAIDIVPDYLNHRDSIFPAFMGLSDSDKVIFASELYMLCRSLHDDKDVAMLMATTGMWCESFLRTIGKWEGGAE